MRTLALASLAACLFLTACVGVQRPDGGTGVAVGMKSETAAAVVSSLPGGDILASIAGLTSLGGAGSIAFAAYQKGQAKGWDDHAKESKANA